ncbi:hypothetical protein KIPB_016267, partial [Kipferlia bialata]|eukprot:g16267.t1
MYIYKWQRDELTQQRDTLRNEVYDAEQAAGELALELSSAKQRIGQYESELTRLRHKVSEMN